MAVEQLKFSLVLATVGRSDDVARFLVSLEAQRYRNFELIVVDQNKEPLLAPLLASYAGKFPIVHLKSAPGLSRARNVGLRKAAGDIIAFPDDDCWYPCDLLQQVAALLQKAPQITGFTGRTTDGAGGTEGRWLENPAVIDRYNVWKAAISFTIFLRRSVVEFVGDFDETLGVGAGTPWGSGEETDYLLRALQGGFRLHYDPSLVVFHPIKVATFDEDALKRSQKYAPGFGRVLRKNGYNWAYFLFVLGKAVLAALIAVIRCDRGKSRFYFASATGRLKGWLA